MPATDDPIRSAGWVQPTKVAFVVATVLGAIETIKAMVVGPSIDPTFGWRRAVLTNMSWWYLWVLLVPVIVWISDRVAGESRVRSGVVHVGASVLLSALHIAGASLVIWAVSSRPFLSLGGQARSLLVGYGVGNLVTYWAIAGAYGIWVAHRRLARSERERHELELRATQLEARMTEARLAALRQELNPHFLFNTLNSVSALARRGSGEEAVEVLNRLGILLRRTLDEGTDQEVPLEEEIDLLELYLEIERVRFSDRLCTEVSLDPAARGVRIPALLLQPLVENAIRHGVAGVRGPVRVTVTAEVRGDTVEIRVRDTGAGLPAGATVREGVGLRNTRERLATVYGDAGALELVPLEGGGTEARVVVPFRAESEAVRV